jgi:hypothetical protein
VKYAVEMGSGAMVYITRFHKDWLRHSKVNWGGGGDKHRGDDVSLLFIFSN